MAVPCLLLLFRPVRENRSDLMDSFLPDVCLQETPVILDLEESLRAKVFFSGTGDSCSCSGFGGLCGGFFAWLSKISGAVGRHDPG